MEISQTPFQVAYRMSFDKPRWNDLFFVCGMNASYSTNTVAMIDYWLDVILELRRIRDTSRKTPR